MLYLPLGICPFPLVELGSKWLTPHWLTSALRIQVLILYAPREHLDWHAPR